MRAYSKSAALAALFICLIFFSGAGLQRGQSSLNPGIKYPFRVAYITDTHVSWLFGGLTPRTAYHLGHVVDTCNALGIDVFIWGGDWSEDTFQDANNAYNVDSLNAIFGRARFRIWPVLGNHEAWKGDTLGQGAYNESLETYEYGTPREPYYTAIRRSWASPYFNGLHYHSQTWKNITFVALQNNANYSIGDPLDYRVNNPTNVAAPNGITGYDFDGITQTSSRQRVFLRGVLHSRDKSHWLFVAAHRPVYGSNYGNTNRHSLHYNLRSTHFVKEVEDSLRTGERCLFLWGDQHLGVWFTQAIRDSALASSTGKGGYHYMCDASGGVREADTTEVFPGGLQSFLYTNPGGTALISKASTTWTNGLTVGQDADINRTYTWTLLTVYGDHILVETFRTFGTVTSSTYTKGGYHRLIDSRTISRDVG